MPDRCKFNAGLTAALIQNYCRIVAELHRIIAELPAKSLQNYAELAAESLQNQCRIATELTAEPLQSQCRITQNPCKIGATALAVDRTAAATVVDRIGATALTVDRIGTPALAVDSIVDDWSAAVGRISATAVDRVGATALAVD